MLPLIDQILHLEATICSSGGETLETDVINEIASDILPHPLSIFQFFLDEIFSEEIFDCSQPQNGEFRVTGQTGKISLGIFISLNARPPINSFHIIGSKGKIHLDLFHDFAFIETGQFSKMRKILHPFNLSVKIFSAAFINLMYRTIYFETAYPGLQKLINCFYQSIFETAELPISSAQTINIARIRDYLISSASKKK